MYVVCLGWNYNVKKYNAIINGIINLFRHLFHNFNILADNGCKKLKQMKNDKSPGPDGIHLLVIKKMA